MFISNISLSQVEAHRKEDAEAGVEIASILEGAVQRKVIKQSVMTTVYGVTLYGAMAQIKRQLRELPAFRARAGADADKQLGPASAYLARLTLTSIGKIFTSSAATQAWFGKVRVFSKENIYSIQVSAPPVTLIHKFPRNNFLKIRSLPRRTSLVCKF